MKVMISVLFSLIASASAHSCGQYFSVGIGQFNVTGRGTHPMSVQLLPLPDTDLTEVEMMVYGPEGTLVLQAFHGNAQETLWTFDGTGPGNYANEIRHSEGTAECDILIDHEPLRMVYPIDTRDFGGDLFVSWTPVNGAKEYRVSVIDSDGLPLMSYGLPHPDAELHVGRMPYDQFLEGDFAVHVVAMSGIMNPVDAVTGEPDYTPGIRILRTSGSTTSLDRVPRF